MLSCDTLIQNARVLDGSGAAPETLDVAVRDGHICEIGMVSVARLAQRSMHRTWCLHRALSMSIRTTTPQ